MIEVTVPANEDAFRAGRNGLHALNFFHAALQTGFGPFISVWLVSHGWSLTEVGVALSIGTIVGLVSQLPGGVLVDMVHHKRDITAIALAVVAGSALMIAVMPAVPAVWLAQALHALGTAVTVPAIAAMTLSLCGHEGFGDRLGGNARYASLGSAFAALALGLVSDRLGEQSVFVLTAALALPAVASLFSIRAGDGPPPSDHMAIAHPKQRETKPWVIFADPVMHVFASAVLLFQFGNAAMLPLALGRLSQRGEVAGFIVPAAIIIPQLVVAIASPWAGAMARLAGRRLVLFVGFVALPARALLFATDPGALTVDVIQVLDGVSATVLGLMPPLIAADRTRETGHLNLAIGSFGLASGLGATFSTTAAGWVADHLGADKAFLALAAVGVGALLLLVRWMPETRPSIEAREADAAV